MGMVSLLTIFTVLLFLSVWEDLCKMRAVRLTFCDYLGKNELHINANCNFEHHMSVLGYSFFYILKFLLRITLLKIFVACAFNFLAINVLVRFCRIWIIHVYMQMHVSFWIMYMYQFILSFFVVTKPMLRHLRVRPNYFAKWVVSCVVNLRSEYWIAHLVMIKHVRHNLWIINLV